MKRGDVNLTGCGTPYCNGVEGRCWLCGGAWSECLCGFRNGDCLCGIHAESWRDATPMALIAVICAAMRAVWWALRGDTWALFYGWRGR